MDGDWEDEAENWVRWARTPRHDAYWYYSPAFFEEIVPPPGRLTLEVGCGEGRVARDLVRMGHTVVAVDSSPTLVRYAVEADQDASYVLADAAKLPFVDSTFNLVVSYNTLMDVQDMPGTVGESARVLTPGGQLCVSVTHPLNGTGSFRGEDAAAPFVISGSYFGRRPFEATLERDGLRMTFRGWLYGLEDYARALEEAGLVIEAVREPRASDEATQQDASYIRWQRLPMFLFLRARKL